MLYLYCLHHNLVLEFAVKFFFAHPISILMLNMNSCTVWYNLSSVFVHTCTANYVSDTFTIDQAIENIGFGRFQLKLSIFTGICWVCTNLC